MGLHRHRFVTWVAAGLAGWLALAPAAGAEHYTFAVVPQFPQRQLFAIWKPIVDDLDRRTGLDLQLVATLTVPEFERQLAKGSFDFAYTNPYQILREFPRQGYIPLVRDAVPLTGIIVVAKDSPVHDVRELDGKLLAVPSPDAVGASLLIQADLAHLYHVRMRLLDAKTHSSVYLHVVDGLADAGGGVQKSLEEQPDDVRAALRILYTTREFPSHPVSAHPRVPPTVREAVRAALLAMAVDPRGRALLDKVPMTQPVATSIDDYRPMAAWGLERYWTDSGAEP